MPDPRAVVVHDSKEALVRAVADRFLTLVTELQAEQDVVHVCLTGGSVGIGILDSIASAAPGAAVQWHRVHFWWGDERWLPAGDAERNDRQAIDALLSRIEVPAGNIHRFAASDAGIDLDGAAARYADELSGFAGGTVAAPSFDVTFLGVGPDGHIASLFPHHEQIAATATVVAVRDSPKPPAERLSLTLPVLNASSRVWLALAGADKASSIGLALAGASRHLVPVAGVQGTSQTIFYVDTDAAANVPRELIIDAATY